MDFTPDELAEALRQIESTISKLDKALAGLSETATSQRTLVARRIKAFQVATTLIRKQMKDL